MLAAPAPSPGSADLLPVFNALPGANLLLAPDLRIVAASDDYLAATLTERTAIVGQYLFDVFPDNPAAPEAHATHNLRASLEQVLATGQPHQMARQHYDVPDPACPGGFVERYWLPTNCPVRDAAGRLTCLIHTVVDVTDQHRAGHLLRAAQAGEQAAHADAAQQRATLAHYLDRTQTAVCVLRGPTHTLDYFNPRFARFFAGRPLPLGGPMATVFPGAIAQGLATAFDAVYATGTSFVAVEQAISIAAADGPGSQYYFTFSIDAYQEHGRTVGVSLFALDVTQAVRARHRTEALQAEVQAVTQQQAREREEFAQILTHTPAAICILRGPTHRYEYVNAAYQQFLPDRQLLGRPVAEALPETQPQGFVDLLDAVYRTGETYFGHEQPLLLAQPGGLPPKRMYFNFTYQAYRENGAVVGLTTFAYEVTEQVLARQERELQRQQLVELFMQASVPIVVGEGPAHVFTLVNPAYQRLFPGRKLLGKPLRDAMPELADTPIPVLLDQVYNTGETVVVEEMLLHMARTEGGPLEEIYWSFSYQARRNAQGAIDGICVFAQDVTTSVRARQQLLEANQALTASNAQLSRTNKDLDTFIYTASHDLKTPIANIEGLLHALQRALPAEIRQHGIVPPVLDRMQKAVDRFQLTIAQLTDLTKLQRADAQPAEPVDLAALIKDVHLDLDPQLTAANARLTVEVAGCPHVSFAPKHLRSIVFNLLSNAVKYRHPDREPHVQLRCRSTDHAVVFEVEDNGLGLTEAQQGKLFGLFRRLHDHVEGSGIGLYMVKRIVENAGGTIAVQSTSGVGSTFTVTLPAPAPPVAN